MVEVTFPASIKTFPFLQEEELKMATQLSGAVMPIKNVRITHSYHFIHPKKRKFMFFKMNLTLIRVIECKGDDQVIIEIFGGCILSLCIEHMFTLFQQSSDDKFSGISVLP